MREVRRSVHLPVEWLGLLFALVLSVNCSGGRGDNAHTITQLRRNGYQLSTNCLKSSEKCLGDSLGGSLRRREERRERPLGQAIFTDHTYNLHLNKLFEEAQIWAYE